MTFSKGSSNVSDLYDADILGWTEHQASLLRRRAAGELVNDGELDWTNIAEEIESLGRSETRACQSHLLQALLHDLKADAWPLSRDEPHWRAEALQQRWQARKAFSPSMRQHIDVASIYRDALKLLPVTLDGLAPLPLPPNCKVTLDDLLAEPP